MRSAAHIMRLGHHIAEEYLAKTKVPWVVFFRGQYINAGPGGLRSL